MRITYRTLSDLIGLMNDEQKDSDVTVEILWDNECYPAALYICDKEHDSLDDGHPVIVVGFRDQEKKNDIAEIAKDIGLLS